MNTIDFWIEIFKCGFYSFLVMASIFFLCVFVYIVGGEITLMLGMFGFVTFCVYCVRN